MAACGGASQGGFHHALEALVAERALLPGIRAKLLQVFRFDACVQPLLVGEGALGLIVSRREVKRVGCDEWDRTLGPNACARSTSGSLRCVDHRSTHRIEFDVAVAVQYMAFPVAQAGLAAAFPHCPGALVTRVELADVAAARFLHETSSSAREPRIARKSAVWHRQQQKPMYHSFCRTPLRCSPQSTIKSWPTTSRPLKCGLTASYQT